MCGLTGLAMHPKSKVDPMLAAALYADLLGATQSRGDHATGTAILAATGGVDTFKRAMSAAHYFKLRAANDWIDSHFSERPLIALGHTRWATHNNRHLDSAAHPFTYGKVTGAHNGILRNYDAVERQLRTGGYKTGGPFAVDSEAAFAALDAMKSPVQALEMLSGYFALTWIRGGSLYVARTPDAPLTVTYVPSLRLMAYNSERGILAAALTRFGLDVSDKTVVEFYDPQPGEVYRYVPTEFNGQSTNVRKIGAFKLPARAAKGFNSARPTAVAKRRDDSPYSTDFGNVGTIERSEYVNVNGAIVKRGSYTPAPIGGKQLSLDAMRVAQFDRQLAAMEQLARDLTRRVATLEAELDLRASSLDADTRTMLTEGGACSACGFIGSPSHPLRLIHDELLHDECSDAARDEMPRFALHG